MLGVPRTFLVLAFVGLSFSPASVLAVDHETDLMNTASFLSNQYNSGLQLLAEVPSVPDIYWLWTDNFLGYHALKFYDPETATAIWTMLEHYGYMQNYAYEALFGQLINLPFRESTSYTIKVGPDFTIRLDLYNGSRIEDWSNYANLLCLAALSESWQGHSSTALDYFNRSAQMWDGTGLKDPTFTDEYQTYKLALLLYTERLLGQTLAFHDTAETTLWRMQNYSNYGIHTGYNATLEPRGDVNVETTSLVIGLYKWEVYTPPHLPYWLILVSVIVVSTLLLLYVILSCERDRNRAER